MIRVSTVNSGRGSAHRDIPASGAILPAVGFNLGYIRDALKHADGPAMEIGYGANREMGPIFFNASDTQGQVIMPMRI